MGPPALSFLPTRQVLSRVFRGKFLAGLKRLHRRNGLQGTGPAAAVADDNQFAKLLRRLDRRARFESPWTLPESCGGKEMSTSL